MDDEGIERILREVVKQLVAINSEALELAASLAVLKLRVAALAGHDPEVALDDFRQAEKRALEALPVSQRLQKLRELLDVLEKHGKTLGKNQA